MSLIDTPSESHILKNTKSAVRNALIVFSISILLVIIFIIVMPYINGQPAEQYIMPAGWLAVAGLAISFVNLVYKLIAHIRK